MHEFRGRHAIAMAFPDHVPGDRRQGGAGTIQEEHDRRADEDDKEGGKPDPVPRRRVPPRSNRSIPRARSTTRVIWTTTWRVTTTVPSPGANRASSADGFPPLRFAEFLQLPWIATGMRADPPP